MAETKTAAIVVTYNRKELLLECLKAVSAQSSPCAGLFLMDNHSTDGTLDVLLEHGFLPAAPTTQAVGIQSIEGSLPLPGEARSMPLYYYRLPSNIGGAGGFNEGLRQSRAFDFDFLWLMDDDTIAERDALAGLHRAAGLLASRRQAPGFVCSKVLHSPEAVHFMNLPHLEPVIGGLPFNTYEDEGILLVRSASFVSLLLPVEVVRRCGLPIRNFFLWYDDVEYTSRISRAGYIGAYARESRVRHKTPVNHYVDIFDDRPENLHKYRWGVRNQLVCLRRENPWLYCFAVPFQLTVKNWRLLRRRSHRWQSIWIQTLATVKSIFFIPRE